MRGFMAAIDRVRKLRDEFQMRVQERLPGYDFKSARVRDELDKILEELEKCPTLAATKSSA